MTTTETKETLPSLWRNRDYMLLWSGQLVSTLGSGVSQFAYPLLVLSLTRQSYAQAGLVAALFSVPYVLFSLPAGALIDRWNRKRVMMLCDAGRACSMASIPLAAALGLLTVGQIYVAAFIEGSLFVFFNIAEVACLPRVVPSDQLPTATAQNEGGAIAALLISSPLGGLLFQIGRTLPFLADALSYGASVASLFLIRTSFQGDRVVEAAATRSLRAEIAEGVRWLWRHRLIRFMSLVTGGLNFSSTGTFLIVIAIAKGQHAEPSSIGIVLSIASVGGLAGAALAPRMQRRFSFGEVIIVTTWLSVLVWPLIALAPNVFLVGVALGFGFVVGPIFNAMQFTYRVRRIPDALQGRVNSAFRLVALGFQPLGATVAGLLLQRGGPTLAIAAFTFTTAIVALAVTLNPDVRRADKDEGLGEG